MEIIDHNRALVDGPTTGVERKAISFKDLALTDLKVNLPRAARTAIVQKVVSKEAVQEQWAKTNTAKKVALRKIRANLNDFERFKVMALKQKKRAVLHQSKAVSA